MSKLKNVKAVKEMLEGKHKTQTKKTVSFEKKEFVKREVGEIWTDEDGQEWTQKKGYKVKLGKLHKHRHLMKKFPNCRKDVCTCTDPGQADLKMKGYHGMCLDCVVEMEHKLKMEGKYEEYEKKKMLFEKDILKGSIEAQFINEDGSIEKWGGLNKDEVIDKIERGFEKFKTEYIGKLKEELNGSDSDIS